MLKTASLVSWVSPLALVVALPANALQLSIQEQADNPGFEITNQFIERDLVTNVPTEFEIFESWTNLSDPDVSKRVSIDYTVIGDDPAFPDPAYSAFEFEFKVTNDTMSNWSSYGFTFSGLGGLALSDVLVGWENELEDIDFTPVFDNSQIDGNTLTFFNGSHDSGSMVSYELFFDLNKMFDANINGFNVTQAVVPEPSLLGLMAIGLIGIGFVGRKRKQA